MRCSSGHIEVLIHFLSRGHYGSPADTWNTLSLSSEFFCPLDERVERRGGAHSDRLVGFKCWYAAAVVADVMARRVVATEGCRSAFSAFF